MGTATRTRSQDFGARLLSQNASAARDHLQQFIGEIDALRSGNSVEHRAPGDRIKRQFTALCNSLRARSVHLVNLKTSFPIRFVIGHEQVIGDHVGMPAEVDANHPF